MIADDAIQMRDRVAAGLPQDQFEVVAEAATGREAVQCYEKHRPDLLILDLQMPVLDGLSAMREIFEIDSAARILVYGSLGQEADLLRALDLGAADFLMKSFVDEDLVRNVVAVLESEAETPDSDELFRRAHEVAGQLTQWLGYAIGYRDSGDTRAADAHVADAADELERMQQKLTGVDGVPEAVVDRLRQASAALPEDLQRARDLISDAAAEIARIRH